MIFDFIGRKERRIKQLESENFDLARKLFEIEQFHNIAREKLAVWVKKHDDLLILHKKCHDKSVN